MLGTVGIAFAQQNPHNVPKEESAFVEQAPTRATAEQIAAPETQAPDATSKVYFPDAITPESVAEARRARGLEQQQLNAVHEREEAELAQVSAGGEGAQDVDQLSDGMHSDALAQLTQAEREVLLEAVEGTDICDRSSDIPAIQELCESRLETRSADFAQNSGGSAEDNLLGGGLSADRLATLESAIARLARNASDSNDFSNQVIASVALNNQTLADGAAQATDADPTSDLSPETQAVVNAIVQQLGGN